MGEGSYTQRYTDATNTTKMTPALVIKVASCVSDCTVSLIVEKRSCNRTQFVNHNVRRERSPGRSGFEPTSVCLPA